MHHTNVRRYQNQNATSANNLVMNQLSAKSKKHKLKLQKGKMKNILLSLNATKQAVSPKPCELITDAPVTSPTTNQYAKNVSMHNCPSKEWRQSIYFNARKSGRNFTITPIKEEHLTKSEWDEMTNTWHKRLGYFNLQRMIKLRDTKLSREALHFTSRIANYNTCKFGKLTQKPFSKSNCRAKRKL